MIFKRPMTRHFDVVFPNGDAIPFADAVTGRYNKTPPRKSDLYHGWGIGALRDKDTAAAMNWGNLTDGHAHNDMLNLLYWGNGLLMLNTTEYPARNVFNRTYWRESTGAHNTVMVDGRNHKPSQGNPMAWGVTEHCKVMQGFSDRSHPGATLRRTAFLVNSRPGKAPYLVDFFQVDGGRESYDYFLQGQSARNQPLESLEVRSPKLVPSGKESLDKLLSNAGKYAYPFIRNPESGAFSQNADLLWTFPHKDAYLYLHGIFVPEKGKNTLYVGNAPGVRYHDSDPKDRTVRKVVWRRSISGKKDVKNCFLAAFEYADAKDSLDLKRVLRLPVSGNPNARAVEVSHGSGKDILLLSDVAREMRVETSAGVIVFRGIAAVLSFDANGKPRKATSVGLCSLTLNDRKISGGTYISGRLEGIPSGLANVLTEEKNAVVTISKTVPADAVGNMLFVRYANGTIGSYRIEGVKALGGGKTELQLDRSIRKIISLLSVKKGNRTVEMISGGGEFGFFTPLNNCRIDGVFYRIQSITPPRVQRCGGEKLETVKIKLEKPVHVDGIFPAPITEFNADDEYWIMTAKTAVLK